MLSLKRSKTTLLLLPLHFIHYNFARIHKTLRITPAMAAGSERPCQSAKKIPLRLVRKIQEQNLLRQYDLLSNYIEIGLAKGIEEFDKYTL